MKKCKIIVAGFCLLLIGLGPISVSADLIMSAPPREKADVGKKVYGPVAAYMSKVLGQKVVYRHPGAWGIYQGNLQLGKYDIVFDGPHFVGWRVSRMGHNVVASSPGKLIFVVAVAKNSKHKRLRNLRGRAVCGLAPPNLATLTLFNEIGVGREPRLVSSTSFPDAFNKMLAGKCDGVVMRDKMYNKLAKKSPNKTRVVFTSKGLPNQAITVGKKVNKKSVNVLKQKLLTPEANKVMSAFMSKYTGGKGLKPANNKDYKGLEILLKDIWGFGV